MGKDKWTYMVVCFWCLSRCENGRNDTSNCRRIKNKSIALRSTCRCYDLKMHPFYLYFPNFRFYAGLQPNKRQKNRSLRVQRVQRNIQQLSFRCDHHSHIHYPNGHGRIRRRYRQGIPFERSAKHHLSDSWWYGAYQWFDYQAFAIRLVPMCLSRRKAIRRARRRNHSCS